MTRAKNATKTAFMVEASMISTRIITSAFPARTEFSETTALNRDPSFGVAWVIANGSPQNLEHFRALGIFLDWVIQRPRYFSRSATSVSANSRYFLASEESCPLREDSA